MSKKETGLMFKAPLVRAILSGQKTQTRRICKLETVTDDTFMGGHYLKLKDGMNLAIGSEHVHIACPTGGPGDRIYVRETWAEIPRPLPLTDESLPMRKDDRIIVYKEDPDWDGARQFLAADGCIRWAKPARWSPSIHMPKHAARIWLEVTSARVERLQDISEADAIAEGITGPHHVGYPAYRVPDDSKPRYSCARAAFESLWESTGGNWAANPWVWVIDFKRIGAT
ncbi:hypothetical protein P245_25620 [Comamonas thiooxydans]|uniref:Morphogenetic protein n=1 Tax=Comamonas thiooxydans TaxID=363952 RepID=A0A0E3BD27_9BURK|nr:hypothetical protein [Comamonas thiooxydans]KGG82858.1 hypothetical protein P245_25620 [Comamonas thiooxydans]